MKNLRAHGENKTIDRVDHAESHGDHEKVTGLKKWGVIAKKQKLYKKWKNYVSKKKRVSLEEKNKSWKAAPPKILIFPKKNQSFRTIGPSMAPLELLSKRQAVVFKAPCAYIGPPAIYIGLEPILEKKKIHVFFCWTAQWKKIWIFFFFFKNWLQTYIDGRETYIGTWSFENQYLKRHRELQGSHRRANGAKILFFFENIDFRRCSFSGAFKY